MTLLIEERIGRTLLLKLDTGASGLLTAKHCAQLETRFAAACDEDGVRAIVLTGAAADVFVRHFDIASIIRSAEALQRGDVAPDAFPDSVVFRAYQSVATCPKPVIAAINGVCMGGGFELALCCALRIAGEQVAQIGLPETRTGILPGGGGTQRLPRLIGEARALEFILRGAVVDARAAHAIGLVNETAADALARALEIAEKLGQMSAPLLAQVLSLVRGALDRPLSEGLRAETMAFAALLRDDAEALAQLRRFLGSERGLGDYSSADPKN